MGKFAKLKRWAYDNENAELLICIISCITGILFLSITTCAKPAGDDCMNLLMDYNYIKSHSFLEALQFYYGDVVDSLLLKNSRFFPFFFPPLYIRYFLKANIVIYRLYIILYTYVDIILIGVLISKALKNRRAGRFFVAVMPLMLCTWTLIDNNALYSYEAIVQACFFSMLLSGLFAMLFGETGKKRYIVLSIITAFYGCSNYELAFVLVVPVCFLMWIHEGEFIKAFIRMLPTFAGQAIALGFNLASRFAHKAEAVEELASGVQFGFDIKAIVRTFLCQLNSCFPFNSMIIDGAYVGSVSPWDVILSLVISVIIACLVVRCVKLSKKNYILLFISGLTLMTLPALLISLSGKYQDEAWVNMSYGYIPSVVQSMGLGMVAVVVLAVIFQSARKLKSRSIQAAMLVAVIVIGTVMGTCQRSATRERWSEGGIWYDWFAKSVETGLLENYPKDALYVDYNEVWGDFDIAQGEFVKRYSERPVNIIYVDNFNEKLYEEFKPVGICYMGTTVNSEIKAPLTWIGEMADAEAAVMKNVRLYLPKKYAREGYSIRYFIKNNGNLEKIEKSMDSLTFEESGEGVIIQIAQDFVVADMFEIVADR